MDTATVLARSPEVVYSELSGEVTMMSVASGRYFGLASVGARIWQMLDQPVSVESICERLTREYRVGPADCERDVLAFARRMIAEGVAVVVPAGREGN